jgi:hypothetical protein
VTASLTKKEHRSVSGLFTRRGVDLCWDEIETRPETQREQLRQLEEMITVAASAFLTAMMQQNH